MEINEERLGRLKDAVDSSFRGLSEFREKRTAFIRSYAGEHYAGNRAKKTPLNMIELAVGTYCHRLAANSPAAHVTTPYMKLRPYAGNLQLALDYVVGQLGLASTLKRAVKDAIFGIGIVKVGINDCDRPIRGFSVENGQPFAELVSVQDFVFDTTAKTWKDCQFFGSRFMVDAEAARKAGYYKNLDKVNTASYQRMDNSENAPSMMTTNRAEDLSRYRDRYVFWEIWLPFENIILTTDEDISVVLKVQKWTGPSCGPYHILEFSEVPDNILPLPPAALWIDIHDFANRMWRKIFRQADRQKNILPYQGGSQSDAERIMNSEDGDVIRVDDAKSFGELSFGGPRQEILSLAVQLDPIFSRYAGNLDISGGLSPMGRTASQDAILNQNSGIRFDQMSLDVREFVRGILRSIAFWIWSDESVSIPLTKRLTQDAEIEIIYDRFQKVGSFLDYSFDIVPCSMSPKTPAEKLETITQFLTGVYQIYAQMMEQQGITLNMHELLRLYAEYSGVNEFNSIFTYGTPAEPGGEDAAPPKQQTHSVYERVNTPGASYSQQMNALARSMNGENLQNKEMRTIGQ